ncbi:MAG: hypothetical protein MHPSP_000724, partial [Paramarteilia canceri]
LTFSITKKNTNIFNFLINLEKINFKIKDSNGMNLLLKAVTIGSEEMVKVLMKKGISLDSRDKDQNTALHLACEDRNFTMSEFLLKNGIDKSLKNKSNQTALEANIYSFDFKKKLENLFSKY